MTRLPSRRAAAASALTSIPIRLLRWVRQAFARPVGVLVLGALVFGALSVALYLQSVAAPAGSRFVQGTPNTVAAEQLAGPVVPILATVTLACAVGAVFVVALGGRRSRGATEGAR